MFAKSKKEESKNLSYIYGRWLAKPIIGEEVVITGLSGSFPNSKNVYEFQDNLFKKIDMISNDDRRWKQSNMDIPHRTGKLYDIEKFDAGFFGIRENQSHTMDPLGRMFMEKAVEAIFDAGVNPKELEGTKTAVFVGFGISESQNVWFYDKILEKRFAITGSVATMIPNRISYHLKLNGPTCIIDAACASSLYAVEHAYREIRNGNCDSAIIGGINLCLNPILSLQFANLGVLSWDGSCKVFDNSANGYVRSEAICAIFLQKAKNAKRIYSYIVHSNTSNDGYKDEGITHPTSTTQAHLLKKVYDECQLKPEHLTYIEAHGTGTKVGDMEEINGIDKVICSNRKTPLLIGSVKSNVGHTETASGLISVTKAIIAFETGLIPPNLNYTTPRIGAEALEKGKLKVVTENTPIASDALFGINAFGFGGANCHVLLRGNMKKKVRGGLPEDDLPRLICVSGREEESINLILDDIKGRLLDAEYISLYHKIFSKETQNHLYRGYSIITKSGELNRSVMCEVEFDRKPLYLVFNNFDINWKKIGNDLLSLPIFLNSIQKINNILSVFEIDLIHILLNKVEITILDKILANAAIQIGIVYLLRILKIKPDGYCGYGFGEIICGYLDNYLDFKTMVLLTYEIALLCHKTSFTNEFSKDKLLEILPELQEILNKTLTKKKIKSNKWLTSSIVEYISSDYFLQCLSNFNCDLQQIKENAIILNIGNLKSLFNDLKNSNYTILNFNNSKNQNYLIGMLENLGSLYEMGYNFELDKLYPEIQYPVSCGTPMISPLIKWNHKKSWFVATFETDGVLKTNQNYSLYFTLKDDKWRFVKDYILDGNNLFPSVTYLSFLWEGFSSIKNLKFSDMQIIIENCCFLEGIKLDENIRIMFQISIQQGSGNFEIHDGSRSLVTGRIYIPKDSVNQQINIPIFEDVQRTEHLDLTSNDIYKELRIRGYSYKDAFKKIESCNLSLTKAYVRWDGNWITFLDNILQLKILQTNSRYLNIPKRINRCLVDFKKHNEYIKALKNSENETLLPVYIYKDLDIIKCGGIEIRGLETIPTLKNNLENTPVLEKYIFIPNKFKLHLNDIIRVNIEIIWENILRNKIKCVELFDGSHYHNMQPLSPVILEIIESLPALQANMKINCDLIIGKKILQNESILEQVFSALKSDGFILSREDYDFQFDSLQFDNIQCLTEFHSDVEKILLLRRKIELKLPILIEISNENFKWIPVLQIAMKNNEDIAIFAQNQPLNGILGVYNSLRLEPGGDKVKCFFLHDQVPPFDLNNDFYGKQFKKNLAVNIYKNSEWGTYRHLLLNATNKIKEVNTNTKTSPHNNLLNLTMIEKLLTLPLLCEQELIYIEYASPNFRKFLNGNNCSSQKDLSIIEISGCNEHGEKYVGLMMPDCVFSSSVAIDRYFSWKIPDNLSLEDSVTLPVAYLTVLYCFFLRHDLKSAETILIYSGVSDVGQAAIHTALHHGCIVYTSVDTAEERKILKQRFPRLTDEYIYTSNDKDFEQVISDRTNGHGFDLILNCIAEEKLTLVRYLAAGGKFFQIENSHFFNNNQLRLIFLEKCASFYGVCLHKIFMTNSIIKQKLHKLFKEFLNSGYIKPLYTTIYNVNEYKSIVEDITSNKFIGKILIKFYKEKVKKDIISYSLNKQREWQYICNPNSSYVIVGGLGGFGLELADWLVNRGARNLILTSRKGLSNGNQSYRIKFWKSNGCHVKISTSDVSNKEECQQLIEEANKIAPIAGIFNLAVVLKDALFENQDTESFIISFKPKAFATKFLDEISRKLCPHLKNFVVFSSLACGRGNTGQTNYGMSNSIIERICEKRIEDGFPATAIQWGAIGDVGILTEIQNQYTEFKIRGTLQQRIFSCLEVLNVLLNQSCPVVCSMVIAKKLNFSKSTIIEAVTNILGIRDVKTISLYSKLAEVGMDSINGMEIKQILETEFGIFLTMPELRTLTLAELLELQEMLNLKTSNVQ